MIKEFISDILWILEKSGLWLLFIAVAVASYFYYSYLGKFIINNIGYIALCVAFVLFLYRRVQKQERDSVRRFNER